MIPANTIVGSQGRARLAEVSNPTSRAPDEAQAPQQQEDDQRGMIARGHQTRRRDVEHVVERGDHQDGRVRRRVRLAQRRERPRPDFTLQRRAAVELGARGGGVRHVRVRGHSTVDIRAEQGAQVGLRLARQQVEAQPRGADRVGFGRDEVPAILEARRRAGERERDQEPQQREHGGFHRRDPLVDAVRVAPAPGHADPAGRSPRRPA